MRLPIIYYRGQVKPYSSIPRVNWAHPLARNLVLYHYDVGGAGGYDLASNRIMAFNSANPIARNSSRWGTTYQIPSSTTDGLKYTSDAALRILPPFSFASGFMKLVQATKDNANIVGRCINSGASSPFWNWTIADRPSGAGTMGVQIDSGGALVASSPVSAVTLNEYHSIIAAAPTNATLNWWFDGLPQTTMTGLTIQKNDTVDPILIGTNNSAGTGGFQGHIYWAAFWSMALSASEARLLHDDPYCFLIYPEDESAHDIVGTARHLQPDVDSSDGSWTNELDGTVLFSSIDEISVADDANYIQSSNNPSSDICKISLSDPSTIPLGSPVKVRYRYKKKDNSPTAADLTVRLLQGVTQITSWSHTGISTSFVTTEQTLSAPELASITDFTDLYLEFTADS